MQETTTKGAAIEASGREDASRAEPTTWSASPELAAGLRDLAGAIGERAAREELGLSRGAYARLVARLPVRKGTIALAERGLEQRRKNFAAGSTR